VGKPAREFQLFKSNSKDPAKIARSYLNALLKNQTPVMTTDKAARPESSARGFAKYSRRDSPGCLTRRNVKKQASESELIQGTASWKFVQACSVPVIAAIDPATILIQRKNLVCSIRREAALFIQSSCAGVPTCAFWMRGREKELRDLHAPFCI
jgi:hypothetical protein